MEIAARRAHDQFAVIGNFDQSPFFLACALRGINQVMLDVYDDPVFMEQLLDICTETVIRYAKAMAQVGAHILNTGDSPAMLLGPAKVPKFALPYQQQVFNELQSYGIPTTLHICGNTTQLLEFMGRSHAHSLELDSAVDPWQPATACRKISRSSVILIRLVHPAVWTSPGCHCQHYKFNPTRFFRVALFGLRLYACS